MGVAELLAHNDLNVKTFSEASNNHAKNVTELAVELISTPSWKYFSLKPTNADRLNRSTHGGDVTLILVDMHRKIIRACIKGNLHERVETSKHCQEWHEADERNHTRNHLVIYANAIVDSGGHCPSIAEVMAILDKMESYVRGNDPALRRRVNSAVTRRDFENKRPYNEAATARTSTNVKPPRFSSQWPALVVLSTFAKAYSQTSQSHMDFTRSASPRMR